MQMIGENLRTKKNGGTGKNLPMPPRVKGGSTLLAGQFEIRGGLSSRFHRHLLGHLSRVRMPGGYFIGSSRDLIEFESSVFTRHCVVRIPNDASVGFHVIVLIALQKKVFVFFLF